MTAPHHSPNASVTALTRRRFLRNATALPLAAQTLASTAQSPHGSELLLIGTQTSGTSKGIYAYRFDSTTGELNQIALAAETPSPTFLALSPDRRILLAVNELDEYQGKPGGSVSSFRLDAATGQLSPRNTVASLGGAPCHVAFDHTGRCAFAANYSGGSAASYLVSPNGTLSEAVSFFQYTGHGPDALQKEPHAHRVTVSPDNRFLMVNDLGLDTIHLYQLDAKTAKLTPHIPAGWTSPTGAGPRALQFHPNGRWAYCVTEMTSTVYVLHWDAKKGNFTTVQELPLLPKDHTGDTGASDIVLDPTGHFAYAANRLDDFLVTLTVSPKDGTLTLVKRSSCGGKTPRHLALDKTSRWLLVANQKTGALSVFNRDPKTGSLAETSKDFPIARPECIVFL